MIVGIEFPGDSDEILKDIQHACHWSYFSYLYACPRKRYLEAAQRREAGKADSPRLDEAFRREM